MRPELQSIRVSFHRSFTVKLLLLMAVFIVAPVMLLGRIKTADDERSMLLRRSLERQGRVIAQALAPALHEFEKETPDQIQEFVSRLGDTETNIRLLYRPASSKGKEGFFYVAASPRELNAELRQESKTLAETGVIGELPEACKRTTSQFLRFTNPAGQEEVLTSLTPLHLANGCWIIITSNKAASIRRSSIGESFWRNTNVRMASLVYILAAGLICWLVIDLWRGIVRFRNAARAIRLQGVDGASFAAINDIPELAGVAEDFDALVDALAESQRFIRKAAEENAHALKAPLAVIYQALEPLKRACRSDSARSLRSIDLIEQSLTRLNALVSSAREVDKTDSDIMYSHRRRLDFSALLRKLSASYQTGLAARGKRLKSDIEAGVMIVANEDLLEPIVENLLENAASFAPPESEIEITLSRRKGVAELTVGDRGPGVDPEKLARIFERYYSDRPEALPQSSAAQEAHFGLGLWIVKRNAESLGGEVFARNRRGGGLLATVHFKDAA